MSDFLLEPPGPKTWTGKAPEKAGARERRLRDKRETAMIARSGKGPDNRTCGDCSFLEAHRGANPHKTHYKCAHYGVSASSSTDWRKKWKTCGRFDLRRC